MRIGSFVRQEDRRRRGAEVNILGVLVTVTPARQPALTADLAGWAGLEIHATDPTGQMIVTIEDSAEEWAGQILTRLAAAPGVLSASLVYHHSETEEV